DLLSGERHAADEAHDLRIGPHGRALGEIVAHVRAHHEALAVEHRRRAHFKNSSSENALSSSRCSMPGADRHERASPHAWQSAMSRPPDRPMIWYCATPCSPHASHLASSGEWILKPRLMSFCWISARF